MTENMDKDAIVIAEDLKRVFIRAQDTAGKYVTIDCYTASDAQFDTWARSRITVQGEEEDWPLEERIRFCAMLYEAGALHVLKKDVVLEEE